MVNGVVEGLMMLVEGGKVYRRLVPSGSVNVRAVVPVPSKSIFTV